MTQDKMVAISKWMQGTKNGMNLELEDQMIISNATIEMLKKIEPVYDKYNIRIVLRGDGNEKENK